MTYKQEITKAMQLLAEDPRVIFIGQSVVFGGAVPIADTLDTIHPLRRIEFPVAEDFQLGVCIGLALEGYVPVCIYPRMDFLVLAMNQLVNHLDKIEEMSQGRFKPKVIIRVSVGSKTPLDAGPQHTQDYTTALHKLLNNGETWVIEIHGKEFVLPYYKAALAFDHPMILIEYGELMK